MQKLQLDVVQHRYGIYTISTCNTTQAALSHLSLGTSPALACAYRFNVMKPAFLAGGFRVLIVASARLRTDMP